MTALVAKEDLVLASSLKHHGQGLAHLIQASGALITLEGCSRFYVPLTATQTSKSLGETHRTGGNCGEPCTVLLFYRKYPHEDMTVMPHGSRIVTVGIPRGEHAVRIIPPCGPERPGQGDAWDYSRFLNDLNITEVSRWTKTNVFDDNWVVDAVPVSLALES
jgi:hypothetical protein